MTRVYISNRDHRADSNDITILVNILRLLNLILNLFVYLYSATIWAFASVSLVDVGWVPAWEWEWALHLGLIGTAVAAMAWDRWVVMVDTDTDDTIVGWEWAWVGDMAEGDTVGDMEDMEGDMDGGGERYDL